MIKRTISIFMIIMICLLIVTCLTSCGNRQIFDTTYNFNKVILKLPNGKVIEDKLESWKDYRHSDQLQIKINGVTYVVHSSNVVLISE